MIARKLSLCFLFPLLLISAEIQRTRFEPKALYKLTTNFGFLSVISSNSQLDENERAKEWIKFYNVLAEKSYYDNTMANWNYNIDVTDDNSRLASEADTALSLFQQEAAHNASLFNTSLISDEETKRLLKKIATVGIKLNATESLLFAELSANMTGAYGKATVCSMNETTRAIDCNERWPLSPDLTEIMAKSKDYELLKYVWESWRNVSGKPIRDIYKTYVQMSNRGARADGFKDTGSWWRSFYEDDNLEEEIDSLWYQLLPLYEQLYAYVRKKLRDQVYGPDRIKNVLPAHVLGNMWAQDWVNIFQITRPYSNKTSVDISENMVAQNYTVLKMFQTADEFFQSLGLYPMPASFYAYSMLEKPTDRQVICHPSAWDFYNSKDFRIRMCTQINTVDFESIHHEMGHIQYFMHYSHLAIPFRDGANPGFHEAIGDTIGISVLTPRHLRVIGLLKNYQRDEQQDINFLYKMALTKVAFLPFGYLIDLWRWKVLSGEVSMDHWNEAWWRLRYKYQGLKPPSQRTEDDFDPGSKFHVPAHGTYLRYFVASILQFQFYQEMCKAANHTGPLHECDFYQNKRAGAVLAKILKMGCSKSWRDVLEAATGQRNMSAKPLLEYFRPLLEWLQVQNAGECFGWGHQWPDEVMKTLSPNRCAAD